MNFEVKNIYASLASTVLVFSVYFYMINGMYGDGRFDGPEGLMRLGQMILWLIGGGIVVNIAMMILFNIIFAIGDKDSNPSTLFDERDKLIELRAVRISYHFQGIGYVGAMVMMALGSSAFMVFNLMLAVFALSGVLEAVLRLALYRRGF
ncbi:MAG: hypothetical protein L3J37_10770 [Rhodobacteraceae bacterium]|nr:hypothetical protein [Paracoccaceae bacterium]